MRKSATHLTVSSPRTAFADSPAVGYWRRADINEDHFPFIISLIFLDRKGPAAWSKGALDQKEKCKGLAPAKGFAQLSFGKPPEGLLSDHAAESFLGS